MVQLVRERIDAKGLRERIARPEDGAVVLFEGTVRNHSGGRTVKHLEYHAYESMALQQLEEVREEALRTHAIRDIGIIHRLGTVHPGECSMAIVAVASHRAAAFEACRFAVDRIKSAVPIWKKEFYENGAVWVEGDTMGL
ncbi:MAG: molybdenum cofactor biosynthesis protein MoaE [Acidobacteria bacterium]|nr:molybdenum cofactor biosynthesis protein MoaE [Acidobacteriota bacterium]